ncbi:MAG: hypothetical protein ACO2PN_17590 [Pyrobaculum sp.]|jgi:uncharacterized membrane protein
MRLFLVGLVLIFAGFLLVLAAPLLALASHAKVEATGGAVGCVVIFFVPICFGAGAPQVVTWGLVAVAVMMALVALVMWLISRELSRAGRGGG